MVVKMRSTGSRISLPKTKPLACDLNLPVFEEELNEPWPLKMSWLEAMQLLAPTREHYMRHFDSPEKRLREKIQSVSTCPEGGIETLESRKRDARATSRGRLT